MRTLIYCFFVDVTVIFVGELKEMRGEDNLHSESKTISKLLGELKSWLMIMVAMFLFTAYIFHDRASQTKELVNDLEAENRILDIRTKNNEKRFIRFEHRLKKLENYIGKLEEKKGIEDDSKR